MKAATKPTAMLMSAAFVSGVVDLVEVVGEGAGHGRHGEEERELRRRPLVAAEENHRRPTVAPEPRQVPGIIAQALRDADAEIDDERIVHGVVIARLRSSRSTIRSTKPPMISVIEIVIGLSKSTVLMKSCAMTPMYDGRDEGEQARRRRSGACAGHAAGR